MEKKFELNHVNVIKKINGEKIFRINGKMAMVPKYSNVYRVTSYIDTEEGQYMYKSFRIIPDPIDSEMKIKDYYNAYRNEIAEEIAEYCTDEKTLMNHLNEMINELKEICYRCYENN